MFGFEVFLSEVDAFKTGY